MWKKQDEPVRSESKVQPQTVTAATHKPVADSSSSTIGNGIKFEGSVTGSGNLLVEGEISGEIHLPANSVTVGRTGVVKAEIEAQIVRVEGEVVGDILGREQVVVQSSGTVRGNVRAPRVTVEDGARVKGSIDTVDEPKPTEAKSSAKDKSRTSEEQPQPSVLPSSH